MHSNMDALLAALEERLDITFKDRSILLEAITHRSYLNEHRDHPVRHNELLEFLGDAVLEIAVTEYLYKRFRGKEDEGVLTNWRAALVNGKSCAKIATEIGLEACMLMSRGEAKDSGTKAREIILANALEALLGAIHVDQGIGAARMVVDALFLNRFSSFIENAADAKSTFQEVAQERFGITPHYQTEKEWGADHDRRFRIAVFLEKKKVGVGEGTSKQEAQQAAAKAALQTITVTREGRLAKQG